MCGVSLIYIDTELVGFRLERIVLIAFDAKCAGDSNTVLIHRSLHACLVLGTISADILR